VNGIIQVKFAGYFGNQLHEYVACRKYAEILGAKLEVPDWEGRHIFGLLDPVWSCDLPERNGDESFEWGDTNIRLSGYFQLQKWIGLLSRVELRRWLVVRPEIIDVCPMRGGSYTAAHMRQGDYVGNPFYANIPERSYLRACEEHGLVIDTWAKQNSPRYMQGIPDFLPDFLMLMRATVLLRANSTFSWWAGALGDGDVYAPVVTDHVGEYDADFIRGNWPRCMRAADDLRLPE
jgi:hypothetical protein